MHQLQAFVQQPEKDPAFEEESDGALRVVKNTNRTTTTTTSAMMTTTTPSSPTSTAAASTFLPSPQQQQQQTTTSHQQQPPQQQQQQEDEDEDPRMKIDDDEDHDEMEAEDECESDKSFRSTGRYCSIHVTSRVSSPAKSSAAGHEDLEDKLMKASLTPATLASSADSSPMATRTHFSSASENFYSSSLSSSCVALDVELEAEDTSTQSAQGSMNMDLTTSASPLSTADHNATKRLPASSSSSSSIYASSQQTTPLPAAPPLVGLTNNKESSTTTSTTTATTPTTTSLSSIPTPRTETTAATTCAPTPRALAQLWVPVPSPSRPRLDPRYASRLTPKMRTTTTAHQHHQTVPSTSTTPRSSPRVLATGPDATPTAAANTAAAAALSTSFSEIDLMPPPGITRDRNHNIFRPAPILTAPSPTPAVESSTYEDTPYQATPSTTRSYSAQRSPSFLSSTTPYSGASPHSDTTSLLYTPGRRHSSSDGKSTLSFHLHQRSKRPASDMGVSDRYIPSRATSNFNFNLWEGRSPAHGASPYDDGQDEGDAPTPGSGAVGAPGAMGAGAAGAAGGGVNAADPSGASETSQSQNSTSTTSLHSQQNLLNTLLRSELLGENENPLASYAGATASSQRHGASSSGGFSSSNVTPLREGGNHLRYQSPRQLYQENVFDEVVGPTAIINSFSLTPVRSAASHRLMAVPPKRKRRIAKVPFKVLDAPALQDDFYLNLVDWSSQNVLAVGLGSCVYLWSACTSKVTKLCDLAASEDTVTAVSWAQRGTHLAVGTNRGETQLWDTIKCRKVRTMSGHSARVGTLAWTGPVLASGSRDRLIYLRDVRLQSPFTDKLSNHKQEVCGLKWSFDEPGFLASGGNDNHLHVIDSRNPSNPLHKFSEHTAAVKAITWSPHQHGLLGSGGGTADRCIRFWNTLSGDCLNKIDTGSQVCNLAWSQNCNEIVSTHGYSLNQIVVWRYPSMNKVVTLTGHTFRVLYLAMSPDGSTVVTGAGDETLRFWQIFPGPRSDGKDSTGGLLFPNTIGSVIR